jgi:hypothetical protein
LDTFYCFIFKFTDSFLCHILSALESIHWHFNFYVIYISFCSENSIGLFIPPMSFHWLQECIPLCHVKYFYNCRFSVLAKKKIIPCVMPLMASVNCLSVGIALILRVFFFHFPFSGHTGIWT